MNKYEKIIQLTEDKHYAENTSRSQLSIGWGGLFGSLFFWVTWSFINPSTTYLYTSIGLFPFSILCLYIGYHGEKELDKLDKKIIEEIKK